jgi:hypothetical protein
MTLYKLWVQETRKSEPAGKKLMKPNELKGAGQRKEPRRVPGLFDAALSSISLSGS